MCIVVINFLSELNGISVILSYSLYNFSLFILLSNAFCTIAFSVGSPSAIYISPKLYFSFVWFLIPNVTSVHILPSSNKKFLSYWFCISPFIFDKFTTVILFWVSVPVLSEHITLLLPNVSTAGSFLIIAFFFAIFVTPIDNTIVTIAGSPSGIAATANPTDVINISFISIFLNIPIINIKKHIPKHIIPKFFPTSPNFFWIGVSGDSSFIIIFAILPTLVFIPVSVTTASACPPITIVVANAKFTISPIAISFFNIFFASFSTGMFSPVNAASSIFKLFEFISLQSAGTNFPASSITISPGTISSLETSIIFSSLFTLAVGEDIFWSASIDFSALLSWIKPNIALNITIAIIIIESI